MPVSAQAMNKLAFNFMGRWQWLNQVLCQDGQEMGKLETNQLIVWWNYHCCQAEERSEITTAAFSLRCGAKKHKQVLLPFKVFYMAELFVTGKYCSVREELPGKWKTNKEQHETWSGSEQNVHWWGTVLNGEGPTRSSRKVRTQNCTQKK